MLLRKLFILCAASFLLLPVAYGQACIIDTNNYELIAPPANEMPCVERGVPFDGVLQFFTPPDLAGFIIDSIIVTSFNNLPTGLSTLCTPVLCNMIGNGRACINITGTTTDTTGFYEILYNGYIYTDQGRASFNYVRANLPGGLPDFYLNVINPGDSCPNKAEVFPTGIANVKSNGSDVFSVYPNPNNGNFNFKLNAGAVPNGQIKVMDVTGRVVFSQPLVAALSIATINVSNYSKGIYLVEYRTPTTVATRKITIE